MSVVIVSGYFNPLHVGHVRMIHDARTLGDTLVVIVNNDVQQMLKKGRIITGEGDRLEVVTALGAVDRAVLAADQDASVCLSLAALRDDYPGQPMIFANGGDRHDSTEIRESAVCADREIELRFGIGGDEKADSSSRINAALGSG